MILLRLGSKHRLTDAEEVEAVEEEGGAEAEDVEEDTRKRFSYTDQMDRAPNRLMIMEVNLNSERRENDFFIYDKDLATTIQSDNFELDNSTYQIPIFNETKNSDFTLLINFPEKRKLIFSSVITSLLMSILFMSVIIFAFYKLN